MAESSLAAVGDLLAKVVVDPVKIAEVQGAITSIVSQGSGLSSIFGLFNEGGGRRNAMSVSNATNHDIEFIKWYLHWGYNKVPPKPYLRSMHQDECLFHNAGSWACTGSSGIVTYKLQYQTNLHIMWECPYNFDFHDNYIGMLLSSEYKTPDKYLFLSMFENWREIGKTPRAGSEYDLVCCGPGNGGSREAGGSNPYGHARTCKVQDDHYTVQATMGDRHATSSKIVILNKNEKTY